MNQKEIVIDAVYKAMRTKAGKLRIYRTSAVESPFEILFKIEARWLDFYLTFNAARFSEAESSQPAPLGKPEGLGHRRQ